MGYSIEYLAQQQIVFIQISGTIADPSEVVSAAREGTVLAAKYNCHKYLADYTGAKLHVSTIDVFEFAKSQAELGYKPTDKCAAVIAGDEQVHHFFETVARNRGWPNIHYFQDLASAYNWLETSE